MYIDQFHLQSILSSGAPDLTSAVFPPPICQAWVECCQRLLPLIIHSILLDDSNGSWRESLSSHIQDFFGFCSRSAQAASRSATPLNSDSGKFESVTQSTDDLSGFLTGNDNITFRSLLIFFQSRTLPARACTTRPLCAPCLLLLTI